MLVIDNIDLLVNLLLKKSMINISFRWTMVNVINLIYIQYLLAYINDSATIKYNKEKRNINFYTQKGKKLFGIIMPINYFDMESLERVLIEENNALF